MYKGGAIMWDEARYICMMEDDPLLDMMQEEENRIEFEREQIKKPA